MLVTSPVCVGNINSDKRPFAGQDDYVKAKFGVDGNALSMFVSEMLKVGFVTDCMSLSEAANGITKDLVVNKAKSLYNSLRRDFRISNPRIAVLALNPVSVGENDIATSGNDVVKQAVDELMEADIKAFGPYAADEFFGHGDFDSFDAVLAMYYDQGAIPFKLLADNEAVRYTVGLPVVCTAPGHDVLFEKAGKGVADENQLRQAIYLAIDIYRNRAEYDKPLGNPLPKLYREKRDDSEKVRFAIPKKKELKA